MCVLRLETQALFSSTEEAMKRYILIGVPRINPVCVCVCACAFMCVHLVNFVISPSLPSHHYLVL